MSRHPLPSPRSSIFALLLLAPIALGGGVMAASERPDPQNPVGEEMEFPPGWQVLLDHPSDLIRIGGDPERDDVYFVTMTPGWHVTTRPGALLWHPDSTAEGLYRAEMTVHLFDPKGTNEGFGLFVGGDDLDGEQPVYDALLIRNSGEYMIEGRVGRFQEAVQPWTASDAIRPFTDATESSVANTLAIDVGAEQVRFEINGERVLTLTRQEVETQGLVGIRVGRFLNLHVSDLKVTPTGE